MGWSARGLDPHVVRQAILGAQWAIGLDLMQRRKRIQQDTAAHRLTLLFTGGVKEKKPA